MAGVDQHAFGGYIYGLSCHSRSGRPPSRRIRRLYNGIEVPKFLARLAYEYNAGDIRPVSLIDRAEVDQQWVASFYEVGQRPRSGGAVLPPACRIVPNEGSSLPSAFMCAYNMSPVRSCSCRPHGGESVSLSACSEIPTDGAGRRSPRHPYSFAVALAAHQPYYGCPRGPAADYLTLEEPRRVPSTAMVLPAGAACRAPSGSHIVALGVRPRDNARIDLLSLEQRNFKLRDKARAARPAGWRAQSAAP